MAREIPRSHLTEPSIELNDTHGHSASDALLKFISTTIQSIRKEASVAGYGGDEFGVFLKVADAAEAFEVAESLRQRLE